MLKREQDKEPTIFPDVRNKQVQKIGDDNQIVVFVGIEPDKFSTLQSGCNCVDSQVSVVKNVSCMQITWIMVLFLTFWPIFWIPLVIPWCFNQRQTCSVCGHSEEYEATCFKVNNGSNRGKGNVYIKQNDSCCTKTCCTRVFCFFFVLLIAALLAVLYPRKFELKSIHAVGVSLDGVDPAVKFQADISSDNLVPLETFMSCSLDYESDSLFTMHFERRTEIKAQGVTKVNLVAKIPGLTNEIVSLYENPLQGVFHVFPTAVKIGMDCEMKSKIQLELKCTITNYLLGIPYTYDYSKTEDFPC